MSSQIYISGGFGFGTDTVCSAYVSSATKLNGHHVHVYHIHVHVWTCILYTCTCKLGLQVCLHRELYSMHVDDFFYLYILIFNMHVS